MNALRILRFELARGLRRVSFWVLFVLFAGLGFLAVQALAGVFDSFRLIMDMGGETLLVSSPYLVGTIIGSLAVLGLPITAAFFGGAIHREIQHRSGSLLWTTPLSKWHYWTGRTGAAFSLNMLLLTSIAVGIWLGVRMPWVDPEMVGPDRLSYYIQPLLLSVGRRTLFAGALVLLAVSIGRGLLAGYLAIIGFLGFSRAVGQLTADLDNRHLAALLDPSGSVAANLVTRTWSNADKNTLLLPLDGLVATNLALWLGVALAVWVVGGLLFRPERQAIAPNPGRWRLVMVRLGKLLRGATLPLTALHNRLPLWLRLTTGAYRAVILHPVFLATLLFGLVSVALSATSVGMLFGTPTWPVTYAVLGVFTSVFEPFAVGLVVFFTGHLVWREQQIGLRPIVDPTPHRAWLPLLTRLLAMIAVCATLQGMVMAAGPLYQRSQDFGRHEWSTYALDLFGLGLPNLVLIAVLALFLQVIFQQRYLGYLATAAIYLGVRFSPSMGFNHVLYRYGRDPGYMHSEVNRHGDFLVGWWTVKAYWLALAVVLVVMSGLLWPRGVDRDSSNRRRQAQRRFGPATARLLTLAATAFVSLGCYTFYNTNVLNEYQSPKTAEARQVETERTLRPWLDRPHPRIAKAHYEIDLYPSERAAEVAGRLRLENRSDRPVTSMLMRIHRDLTLSEFDLALGSDNPRPLLGGYHQIDFETPLAPGATVELSYRGRVQNHGFANRYQGGAVRDNGTFLGSALTLGLGYDPSGEVRDPRRRKRFGLPPRPPVAPMNDPVGRSNNMTHDADWMRLTVEVRTEEDQVALAPGDLIATRHEGDRRSFTYESVVPVQHIWNVVSGRYSVRADRWQDIDLEIYHHPDHTDNLDSMMRGMKKSLAYLTETFGPYPHKALRIVEFPRYARFAMSLPGFIPYSEGIGFIARKRTANDIDYPFYVTAHEVAHQWFPHVATPADVEGAAFLSETFSQYVALRVMERQFGPDLIGKYLRYELDRYLLGRSVSRFPERPLARVHQQHIYYNKGSLAMFAAARLVGRDSMDAALRAYLDRFAFSGPPYPVASDFLRILREHTEPEHEPALTDLFEKITFFELSVDEATCEALDGGRYRVGLRVTAAKSYADGEGNKTWAELDDEVEVGIFAEKRVLRKTRPKTLLLERLRLHNGEHNLIFEVDQAPLRAGIDPFHTLVDTKPDDNVVDLDCGA